MMAIPVSTQPQLSIGTPRRLFDLPERVHAVWEVSADGKSFIAIERVGEPPKPTIHVVQDWYEEFDDREQD